MAINWNWIEQNRKQVTEMLLEGEGAMQIAKSFESGKAFLDEIVQISKEIEQEKIVDSYNFEVGQTINAQEKEKEAKKIASENKMNSDIEFISNVFNCTLEESTAIYEMSVDMVGKKGAIDNLIALKQQNISIFICTYEKEVKGKMREDWTNEPSTFKTVVYATADLDEAEESDSFYVLSEKKGVKIVEIINCTPHEIVVVSNEITTKYETSENVARVSTTQNIVEKINGIEVVKTTFDTVVGLPIPKLDTVYIVSAMVLSALNGTRQDVIAPDTGNTAIRNEKGQIIAVTRFTK